MDTGKSNGSAKEESKGDSKNLFTPDEPGRSSSRNREDALSDSKEDQEAIPAEQDNSQTNVQPHGNNTSRNNGYMKDIKPTTEGSKIDEDALGKLQIEDTKNQNSKTDRRDSQQHGASGGHNDAGSIDSPHSEAKLKAAMNESHEKNNTEKSLKHDSKDDLGWNEDSKNGGNEDEKNAEERSLLYPGDDANIYKDASNNKDEEDNMRRSSTKPERPPNSKEDGKENSKENEDDDKPKEMTE